MSDIVEFSDDGLVPAVDWSLARKAAGIITGNRKHDRQLLIDTMHQCAVGVVDVVRSISDGLKSPNPIVSAKAREDWFKIVGAYAPQQLEVEANKFDELGYDELQIASIEDHERRGLLPQGSADMYRTRIAGKVRVGSLLVEPRDASAQAG